MNAAATPVMSHQEVDRALRQLRADGDRIAAALVGLGDHPGRRFLDGTRLTGQTLNRWTAAKAAIDMLWDSFARYRDVLDQAERTKDLAELTMLLRGRSVGLPAETVPLDQRGLTGAATVTPRMSLTELVTTMTAAYREIIEVVTTAERVWSSYVEWLDQMDGRLNAATALGFDIPALSRIADEVATMRGLVFADPLSLPEDAGRISRLTDELAGVQRELDALARLREDADAHVEAIRRSLDHLAAAENQARDAVATATAKIATSGLPGVTDSVPLLRQRIDHLTPGGDWPRFASALDQLRNAVEAAFGRANQTRDNAKELLDRRAELRGRLDAYRVKAARLHRGEDAEISALHQAAHDLLWRAPCDLAAATRAVLAYQQAITDKGAAR